MPSGDRVRPTQDRVREALFSSLQPSLAGASFLDLFAGSGAVGLEAWSRGAERVQWVEQDRRVFATLKENVATLIDAQAARHCFCQDVLAFCRGWHESVGFDIIFADPPYAMRRSGAGFSEALLAALSLDGRHSMVAPGALLILEQGSWEPAVDRPGWQLIREREYGRTCLRTYQEKAG